MIPIQLVFTVAPFNAGQRRIGFVRVVTVGLLAVCGAALQQPQSLPQKMRFVPLLPGAHALAQPAA
ncbi:hypothetical protein YEEN111655_19835 [Yersinia entomophaga]